MRLAIITAYTPRYKALAQLCTPSHKCLAHRACAEFYELPMAEDDHYAWQKVDLIYKWLLNWHAVLWLDADCIVPAAWSLPAYSDNCKYFFRWLNSRQHGTTAATYASLWINSNEAFGLLNRMRAIREAWQLWKIRPSEKFPAPEDRQALNEALIVEPQFAGVLDRGLIHYGGAERWDKVKKLRAQTTA